MHNSVHYRIGSIEIALNGDDHREYYAQEGHFPGFLSSSDLSAQVNFQVAYDTKLSQPQNYLYFDSHSHWRLYYHADRRVIWMDGWEQKPFLVADLSQDFLSATIYTYKNHYEPDRWNFPLGYPFGKVFFMNLLGTGLGVMLHACAISDCGEGLLFAGVSGTGKSTTARLWGQETGAKILGEDMIILRRLSGEYCLFATPWHSGLSTNIPEGVPLKKIFLIRHSPVNQVNLVRPALSAAELTTRSFMPLWDKHGMAFSSHFFSSLCQSVPIFDFGFIPNESAVEAVRCLN